MTQNALRLGNILQLKTTRQPAIVIELSESHSFVCKGYERIGYHNFEPIPLTEKILLDSGFNYYENIAKYYHNDKCSISFAKGKVSRFDACTEKGTVILKDMQYIHELQNAYYMATGENLNIVIK